MEATSISGDLAECSLDRTMTPREALSRSGDLDDASLWRSIDIGHLAGSFVRGKKSSGRRFVDIA
jgi:hypothetical protein